MSWRLYGRKGIEMVNDNHMIKEKLKEQSRHAMEEALHREEELEWKSFYFQKKQDEMRSALIAEQEKLRFWKWRCYSRDKVVSKEKDLSDIVSCQAIYCPEYYRSNYPEAARKYGNTERSLRDYFLQEGIHKGDQGCIGFHVWSYRKWNADLEELFGDDLEKYYRHYMNEGVHQKRRSFGMPGVKEQTVYRGVDYGSVYQFYDYLYYNPDVFETFGLDPDRVLGHFVEHGMDEMRRAKTDFYVVQYRNRYDDLREAFGEQYRKYFEHYIAEGKRENRRGVY